MSFYLYNRQKKTFHALESAEFIVGRDKGDVTFKDDSRMSRSHSRFIVRDGRLTVLDLASTNGTWVNQEKLRTADEVDIHVGDTIRIGHQDFIVCDNPKKLPKKMKPPTSLITKKKFEGAHKNTLKSQKWNLASLYFFAFAFTSLGAAEYINLWNATYTPLAYVAFVVFSWMGLSRKWAIRAGAIGLAIGFMHQTSLDGTRIYQDTKTLFSKSSACRMPIATVTRIIMEPILSSLAPDVLNISDDFCRAMRVRRTLSTNQNAFCETGTAPMTCYFAIVSEFGKTRPFTWTGQSLMAQTGLRIAASEYKKHGKAYETSAFLNLFEVGILNLEAMKHAQAVAEKNPLAESLLETTTDSMKKFNTALLTGTRPVLTDAERARYDFLQRRINQVSLIWSPEQSRGRLPAATHK